jgi:Flp pilus assembly pilin Flp
MGPARIASTHLGREVSVEEPAKPRGPKRRSRGATAVEYAIIIALIAGVIVAALSELGNRTEGLYDTTNTKMVEQGL